MARIIRLAPRYVARLKALRIAHGTERARAIARTVAALATATTLPGPLDYLEAIPPVETAYVRRVVGENLWLYYRFTDDELILVTIVDHPP